MSKKVELELTCPQCHKQWDATVYRTIWVEFEENLNLILEDKINLVTCPHCGFSERLPLAFMATNVGKRVAIWYEPHPDPNIDADLVLYRKHYGESSFWVTAPRLRNRAEFKQELVQLTRVPDVPGSRAELKRLTEGFRSSTHDRAQRIPKVSSNQLNKITLLIEALKAKDNKFPNRISEIADFPCESFEDLRTELSSGELVLYRPSLSYNADIFKLMATRRESAIFNVSIVLMWVLPIASLGFALFTHWYWALTCPFFVYTGWKVGRSVYSTTIFRSAAESEISFCLLFYAHKIGVGLPGLSKVFSWKS